LHKAQLPMLSASEANVTPVPLEDLRRLDPFTPDLSQQLLEEGVVTVPTMSDSQCKVVGAAICDAESFIGLEKTGYVTTYYLPEKEVLVTGNPAVYRAVRAAYRVFDEFHPDGPETDFLTISKPERVSIKRTGAKELKKHVDLNFHRSPLWSQPGIRVQAMQVLQIGPWSPEQPNGTLQVVRRFHRYPRLAAAALHPSHGVVGMRQDRFTSKDPLHMFMPFSPLVPLAAFSLYVRVVEALSADTPTPLAEEGAASAADLPHEGYIEGVEVAAIWDHAQGLVAQGGPFSWSSTALGAKDLCWEPVENVASGSLVLWDGGLPHANYPNLSRVTRVVAYLDMSPLHRPNGMPRAERIQAMQLTSSGGRSQDGRDAEKGKSRRGDGHHDNERERDYASSGAWARHAEQRAAVACGLVEVCTRTLVQITCYSAHSMVWILGRARNLSGRTTVRRTCELCPLPRQLRRCAVHKQKVLVAQLRRRMLRKQVAQAALFRRCQWQERSRHCRWHRPKRARPRRSSR